MELDASGRDYGAIRTDDASDHDSSDDGGSEESKSAQSAGRDQAQDDDSSSDEGNARILNGGRSQSFNNEEHSDSLGGDGSRSSLYRERGNDPTEVRPTNNEGFKPTFGGAHELVQASKEETPLLHRHITISRDHTTDSAHEKDLLGALTRGKDQEEEDVPLKPWTARASVGIQHRTPQQRQQLFQQQQMNSGTSARNQAPQQQLRQQQAQNITMAQQDLSGNMNPQMHPPTHLTQQQKAQLQQTQKLQSHQLQDYQMQLMLVEQQNKTRRAMQRNDERSAFSSTVGNGHDTEQTYSSAAANTSVEILPALQTVPSVQQIEHEIEKLRRLQNSLYSTTWQVLHRLDGEATTFLEKPSWVCSDKNSAVRLKGNLPVADENAFLRHKPEAAFVVYKHYSHRHQAEEIHHAQTKGIPMPEPTPHREAIVLLSEPIIAAVDAFMEAQPTSKTDFPSWDSRKPISSPFLFWYYYRTTTVLGTMEEPHRTQMRLLTDWIDQGYSQVYADAEALFAQGFVSKDTMPFFIRPGEVVVSKDNKVISGSIVESWGPIADKQSGSGSQRIMTINKANSQSRDSVADSKTSSIETWGASAWSYRFDGSFHRVISQLTVSPKFDETHSTVSIKDLNIIPLRFADDKLHTVLKRRGKIMWDCRSRRLVAYENDGETDDHGRGERYMIDFKTYRQLHPDLSEFKTDSSKSIDRQEMPVAAMNSDKPPEGPELLVFPSTIIGYNLRLKVWKDLVVDQIHSVVWNKEAFKHLVIDDRAKKLIEALVRTKIEADKGTDLIQGKGNGLIILLHGGPGTGKTFTAESVAELAERPLFRVTCGDVGTKPEQVEQYLESALHLGKIWGCVVLLDEAEVFLEQRTLTDLERNALVSVFLRVLEYYEGILILTSNRVGTFDEAFKSRIQLSLHYQTLSRTQRKEIWKNFVERLEALENEGGGRISKRKAPAATCSAPAGLKPPPRCHKKRKLQEEDDDKAADVSGIDFVDIHRSLDLLADKEMNGRQIRNTITTARQLARFEGTNMSSAHLTYVIGVSAEFDKYLKGVKEGYTDDQLARGDGIR